MKNDVEELKYSEIKKVECSPEEQEFTMTAYRDEEYYSCYCSDNTILTKLRALVKACPEHYKCIRKHTMSNGIICGYDFIILKECVQFLTKKRTYTLSEDEKLKRRERLANIKNKHVE